MPMEEALVARLTAVPGIAAMVGNRVSWFERPRIRPGQTLADVLPAVVLTEASPGRDWTHDGPNGLDRPTVQFDCWAAKPSQAEALARLVQAEMETLVPVTVGGWVFHPANDLNSRRRNDDRLDGGETVWVVGLDLSFFHNQA